MYYVRLKQRNEALCGQVLLGFFISNDPQLLGLDFFK